jgi:hypothetical protein
MLRRIAVHAPAIVPAGPAHAPLAPGDPASGDRPAAESPPAGRVPSPVSRPARRSRGYAAARPLRPSLNPRRRLRHPQSPSPCPRKLTGPRPRLPRPRLPMQMRPLRWLRLPRLSPLRANPCRPGPLPSDWTACFPGNQGALPGRGSIPSRVFPRSRAALAALATLAARNDLAGHGPGWSGSGAGRPRGGRHRYRARPHQLTAESDGLAAEPHGLKRVRQSASERPDSAYGDAAVAGLPV